MIPALLIRTSIFGKNLLMIPAASLIDSNRVKSRWMNCTLVEGLRASISAITEVLFDSVRPRRKIAAAFPAARKMAVWAPRPPAVGPVMTTAKRVSEV